MANHLRSQRTPGLLTAVILLFTAAACGENLPPSAAGPSLFHSSGGQLRSTGPLAFVSTRDGQPYIYVANADGSNATRLAPGERPAWSSDGTRIAFQRGSSSSAEVYVMNADGSGVRSLGRGGAPTWSPDGTRLAFQVPSYGGTIYVMNVDGSGRAFLVTPGFRSPDDGLRTPVWSPDGQSIAFVAVNSYEPTQIFIARLDGTPPRVLVGGADVNAQSEPAWSPDGGSIVLTSGFGIFTVRADGTGWQGRVNGDGYDPDWTPDGQFVFGRFLSGHGEGSPLRIFVGAGGSARQLVPDATGVSVNYWDHQPAWSRR